MMRGSRVLVCLSVAVLGVLLLSSAAQAQMEAATLEGYVYDESGAVLPGVSILITNTDNGSERTVFTNAEGFYRARSLLPGNYSVTATLEGMQTVLREGIVLLVGQRIDVSISMDLGVTADVITVTGESPLIEVSRSSPASYITQEEIQNIPIVGRDFKQFAILNPTVVDDPQRGFITMSGQRGVYSGMNIDGASGKNAFFGYANGGEATENDGLVIAQESVKEFQVIQNGYAPEYGLDGGGFINVITKSGSNNYHGSVFYFFTDEGLAEDIPASPLDKFRDPGAEDRSPDEFRRQNWGLTAGGPIVRDKAHFFVSYDHTKRTTPTIRNIRSRGAYDAILLRAQTEPEFASLVAGFEPNNDGIAAADEELGRTATGQFEREVDNLILLGKFDFFPNQSHSASLRFNYTDYERTSNWLDEENLKQEEVNSLIGSWVAVVGERGINDLRFQYVTDDLNRNNLRVGSPLEAEISFGNDDTGWAESSVGKQAFLPIIADTTQFEFRDSFSYLFGEHDLKFGINYASDNMKQIFAGFKDGEYFFASIDEFLANEDDGAVFYYGDVTFPNYDETQDVWALFAQDSWKPTPRWTVNYGLRWGKTDNPGGIPHTFPEGENIPDDTHLSPRIGFAYQLSQNAQDVLRGGFGVFYGRTPTLLFAGVVQQNGIFPNYGINFRVPGSVGHVPLGEPIPNENPDPNIPPAVSFVDPNYRDAKNTRYNLGYERQIGTKWAAAVDLMYSEGKNLQRNYNDNQAIDHLDQYGRPIYTGEVVDPNFNTIFVRRSDWESKYTAATFKITRRFVDRYSLQAHYTWSEDKDDDSNERNATDITVSNQDDPGYDYGLSDRDVKNRFVVVGVANLPLGFTVSGTGKYQSGTPYTAIDSEVEMANCPTTDCPAARAVINGRLVDRNTFRNESLSQLDVRAAWVWNFRDSGELEIFAEVFNLFNQETWSVNAPWNRTLDPGDITGQQIYSNSDGSPNPEFGVGDVRIQNPRFIQFGVRVRM